jgi:hypothetical protein
MREPKEIFEKYIGKGKTELESLECIDDAITCKFDELKFAEFLSNNKNLAEIWSERCSQMGSDNVLKGIDDIRMQMLHQMVSVLTDDEQQLLKDTIKHGCWGDAEYEFLKSPNEADDRSVETVYMTGYCTNDAKLGGHFEGRKVSSMFRSIYRKMCPEFHNKIGYAISHCNDWWGDGSGDMLFIRIGFDKAFETWAGCRTNN